ncbi:uncharacterized protein LOC133171605 [Saccostrea echinata]|uniref:uncharacterized protein LOC133171605 n=1 Tax=Saccostrea echinata TaxID=191078 RepID=UPI002A81714C|nr:uncharacterized protein LOC133171605 [Saccostrea echinata]
MNVCALSISIFLFILWKVGVCFSNPLQDITCPSDIPNGVLEINCTGHVGSYCEVICKDGFRLHDDVLGIYCNRDGRWSVIETKICQRIQETVLEKSSLNTEAVLGGAATGFLSVFLVYIVVMMVKQKIKKLNDSDDFSLQRRPGEESARRNDYLETVSFISPTSEQSTRVNEVGLDRTEAKTKDELKKPGRNVPCSHEKKKKHHLYHNVFKKGAYENV